ncbi:MAG: hypothetical protein K2Y22_06135 [Candidatus Obscuribacterales bacterium]|nr:hypothetical protein [Candidatus Obscuribacterales bacterium]
MNPTQKQCLHSMSAVAARLKENYQEPRKKFYVPKYGINNSTAWGSFAGIAIAASGKRTDEFAKDEFSEQELLRFGAFSVKRELFELKLVTRGDGYDIFSDLCLNDFWLWSLVEEVAKVAVEKKRFPIDAVCFVDAIANLVSRVPQGKFAALETTLIRVLSERTGTMNLVERSIYLERAVENADLPPLAHLYRSSIGKEYLQEYLDHGLILVDDDRETDPHKADIRFNKLLLQDWQLGQRGPVFARHEGLKVRKYY